jgi:hypothetical protein
MKKHLGLGIAVVGLLVLLASIWYAHRSVTKRIESLTTSLHVPHPPGASPDAQALRDKAIDARTKAINALNQLRTSKATSAAALNSPMARAHVVSSVTSATQLLESLGRQLQQLNEQAEKVEAQAMESIVAYERALNKAIEEAAKKDSKSDRLNDVLLVAGCAINIIGLIVTVRTANAERMKTLLEAEEIRRKLSPP